MPHPIILHHFDRSPFSEKIRVDLRPQGAFVEKRAHSPDHAEARFDAADRRLPPDAGDADRRRRVLRHPDHHPRNRTPISRRRPCFRQARPARPGRSARGPTAHFFRAPSLSCSGRSVRRSRKRLSTIAASCAGPSSISTRCGRRFRRCATSCAPSSAGSKRNSATDGRGSSESSASPTSAPT